MPPMNRAKRRALIEAAGRMRAPVDLGLLPINSLPGMTFALWESAHAPPPTPFFQYWSRERTWDYLLKMADAVTS